jgi:radical SAM superfamily enzyme YgiQ (UPF0313 family)
MRILLVNPPSRPGTTINREGAAGLGNAYQSEGAFLYPPHTLATVAAVLREAGHEPALLDATAEQLGTDAALQRIRGARPEGIGVLLSWVGWEDDLDFCRRLRNARPAMPLVVMGTILRQDAWAAQAAQVGDVVLVGEPERAFAPAMERAISGRILEGTGLVTRRSAPSQDDDVPDAWVRVVTVDALAPAHYDGRGYLLDIEDLPMPAWDLAPVEHYRMLTVLGSRGCDAGCAYCPYVIGWGDRFRACAPGRVVDELAWLVGRFKPARVMFRDPVFGRDRQRVMGICEAIMRRGLSVAWECESRPEHFDADLLRVMQKAGCTTIKIGVESGDAGRLVSLGRIANVGAGDEYRERAREVVHTCRQIGLRCQVFVMGGWEDAGAPERAHTAALIRDLAPQHLSVKRIEAYPGAPWSERHTQTSEEAFVRMKDQLMPLVSPRPAPRRTWWRRGLDWLRRRRLAGGK